MQNNLEIFNELIILFVKLLSVCSQNELVSRYLNNFKRDILTATEMFVAIKNNYAMQNLLIAFDEHSASLKHIQV